MVDTGRPRDGSVFAVYKDVNKESGVDVGNTLLTIPGRSTT